MPLLFRWYSLFIGLFLISFHVYAERLQYTIRLKDNLFYPSELTLPADKKIRLTIINDDNTLEEFDSFDLNRRKVLFPHRKMYLYIGPLPAGKYHFFGEYHPDSAQGTVIVVNEVNKNAH